MSKILDGAFIAFMCTMFTSCAENAQGSSVAVIGGADGPTAVFLAFDSTDLLLTLLQIAIFVVAVVYFIFKFKKSDK